MFKSHCHANASTYSLALSIHHLLQILKDSTEYFLRGTPNLATVTPAMDHIDTTFTNAIKPDSKTHPTIRYALRIKKLVQTGCNWSFVVKFIVPNKKIITSCTLHT